MYFFRTYRAWAGHWVHKGEPPAANLQLSFRLIKELQKKFKTREDEEREKEVRKKLDRHQNSELISMKKVFK